MPDAAATSMAGLPNSPQTLAPLTLVLGGARSGKSAYAEFLLSAQRAPVYLATARADDAEMKSRILAHRARRGPNWFTVEEPLDLPGVLAAQAVPGRAVLAETLTMWLANLMSAGRDCAAEIERLVAVVPTLRAPVVMVTDEVGLGVVPETEMGRTFRDLAGGLNQRMAQLCQRVVFVAAGLPLMLKDERKS